MVLSSINVSSNVDLETKQQFMKDVIAECKKVIGENSGNRCAKYCKEYLDSMVRISMPKVSFQIMGGTPLSHGDKNVIYL
jgi:hypothetical protein